jgi:hypothetical protein
VENYPCLKTAKVAVYTRKKLSKKICFENFEEKAFVMTKRWFVTRHLKYSGVVEGGGGSAPPIFFARCISVLTTSKTHTKISVNENVL